jgi:type II secretion system protein H
MRLAVWGLAMCARNQLARSSRPRGSGARVGLRTGLRARGFTLIELLVVVVIITVIATLAGPAAVAQLRDRRVQESGRKLALLYREARLHSVGRGSAVLVRFDGIKFVVLEARAGALAACPDAPVADCLGTPWVSNPGMSREINRFAPTATSGDLSTQTVSLRDGIGANVTALEVCFSPNGRAYSRQAIDDGTPLLPMTQAYLATFTRPGLGRPRRVALLPNGTARMSAQ